LKKFAGPQFYEKLGTFEFTANEFIEFRNSKECLDLYKTSFATEETFVKFNKLVTLDKQITAYIHDNIGSYSYEFAAPKINHYIHKWPRMVHHVITNGYFKNSFPFHIK
jgi:hypothetical protein